jgi:hypothetical protein
MPTSSARTAAAARPARALLVLVAVLAAAAVALAPPAAAEDTICTGSLGAETHDNVVVPDGATCSLSGTIVEGNVIVGTGSTLTSTGARVDGNVQAEGARQVSLSGGTVGGSVQLEQGGAVSVDGVTVGSDVQVNANTGGVSITRNDIDGNLQCQSNAPAPTGGENVVRGSAEDQCATLTGGTAQPSPTEPAPTEPAPTQPGTTRATSRLSGADRFATAVAIAQRAFPQGSAVAYLARADVAADALAAGSLADGPVLLVPACGEVPEVVLAEIRRLDPTEVIALGGDAAVCDATLQQAAAA